MPYTYQFSQKYQVWQVGYYDATRDWVVLDEFATEAEARADAKSRNEALARMWNGD